MSEDLSISKGTKEEQYTSLLPQISALVSGEKSLVANMSNIAAALKEQFNWWWVGFYIVENEELVLGPFQGPVACTRIKKGRGVCGTAWLKEETLIVPDVNQFPGHIACSSFSKSEIVVPIVRNNEVKAVLDVDSENYDSFDEIDKTYLKQIADLLQFETIITQKFIIRGKVQGVFFRKATSDVATALGLKGTVRNLPDGETVEVVATGHLKQLDFLYNWCRVGSPRSVVREVSKEILLTQEFEVFKIL